jgi:uncharacterized repeat protein (TIGR03803 family)
MKSQRKFPSSSLATAALIAAAIFAGAVISVAQSHSATPAQISHQQETIASTPLTPAFRTLVNFDGANGANGAGFVQGTGGNIYGTSGGGGANGSGVLFNLTPSGTLTVLYSFCTEAGCTDGKNPGGLTMGSNGNLYGVTGSGGTFGYGTIFKFTGSGAPITLHNFDGTDGSSPGGLVQASNGDFYGATSYGANFVECTGNGCGTVFKITPGGTLTTLHDFCSQPDCADGAVLYESLVRGTDGEYYGTTFGGGTANCGTVFKITSKGELTTIYTFGLQYYPFCNGNPVGLALGTDGNFYGVTLGGQGGPGGQGTIFRITPKGELATIYTFCAQIGCTDGSVDRSDLTLGSDGNFYGTTYFGGTHNEGTVFKITPSGVLTTLHSFDGQDGSYPICCLFQATNGVFYGTTTMGGSDGDGTIFSLSVGLGPSGATKLTSGEVKMATPSGKLTSNVNFRATP